MTHPQVMCILNRGKAADEKGDVAARAKKILKDFRSGKFNVPG